MATHFCCQNCFDDIGARQALQRASPLGRGDCFYCGSKGIHTYNPSELNEAFAPILEIYVDDKSGEELFDLITKDWSIFSDNISPASQRDLLAEIFGDRNIVTKKSKVAPKSNDIPQIDWKNLRENLIERNRYFLTPSIPQNILDEALSLLEVKNISSCWYRARVSMDGKLLSSKEMGAPPATLASGGRANPPGIPYLYLASEPETAIAEVRPHKGAIVTVATVNLKLNIKIIDLRNPKKSISPIMANADTLPKLRIDINLLEEFGNELTNTVLPHRAIIDYIPSQYLCELIKSRGYDGVLYNSSLMNGSNIVLFAPDVHKIRSRQNYLIKKVRIESDKCS